MKRNCKKCGKLFIPINHNHFFCGLLSDKGSCSYKNKAEKQRNLNFLDYNAFKYNAIKRGKIFTLTREKFLELRKNKKCCYCNKIKQQMSIDRKENSKGYSDENCVSCCHQCNLYKKDLYSYDEMLKIGKYISNYYKFINLIQSIKKKKCIH